MKKFWQHLKIGNFSARGCNYSVTDYYRISRNIYPWFYIPSISFNSGRKISIKISNYSEIVLKCSYVKCLVLVYWFNKKILVDFWKSHNFFSLCVDYESLFKNSITLRLIFPCLLDWIRTCMKKRLSFYEFRKGYLIT